MKCALLPVTGKHVKRVAAAMRPCDVAEIWASSRSRPREALERGVRASVLCWTGVVEREPVCIFGVSPASLLTGQGVPWMLATPRLLRAQRPFLRLSRPAVDAMQALFPHLENRVDNRNTTTHRWLEWLGFTLDDPAPHGPDGMLFRRFWRVRHV